MTAATLAGALPCFHVPSTKFSGSSGESPSAMWQDWQWVLYSSAAAALSGAAAAIVSREAASAWIIPER